MPLKIYEKDKILDACFKVFVTNGYSKTSTAKLAEAAGISKPLIFHHFGTKKKLYLTILSRCFEKMSYEISNETETQYVDFFEAKEIRGFNKVQYFRKNPDIGKFMFEAFQSTPEELKEDIEKFKIIIKKKYNERNNSLEMKMVKLFNEIPFREGVDSEEAFELINIVSDYFRRRLADDFKNENKMNDSGYWKEFFKKKKTFIDMLRFGIEKIR